MLLLGIWRDHPTACLVVCSLVACVLLLVRAVRRAGRLGHIPGPWYARYTGLFLLAHEFLDYRTKYIHSLHQIYGDVVLVGPAEVSFASCLAGKQIYHDRQVDKSGLYAVYTHLGKDSLFSTRRHDAHRRRRRVVGNYYARSRLPFDLIIKRTNHFVQSLGEEEEMYGKISRLTVETITAVVFRSTHAPVEDDDDDDDNDMRRSIADRQHRDRVRLLRMRGHPLLSFLLSVLLSIFNFARKTAKEEDVITKILGARDEKNGLFATLLAATNDRAYALSETRDHLIAGSDTTTTVLVFLLHHLAFNDSLQEILHASLLQNDDIETNPVLDAILKEALRLWAPIPMSLPRVSSFDKSIDGFFIPAKTRMSSSAYSRHRLPHLFPDPETFNHERFLRVDDDDDDDDDAIAERERGLWAFSSGTRVCIGKALAMLEMKLLIGRLIRAYRLAPGEGLRRTLEMVENCEAFGAGPGHQANIHIRFVRR